MLDMLHSYMSVVCTYHCRGALKNIFGHGFCFLLIFFAKKKLLKALNFNFYEHKVNFQGGRIEEHRIMCIKHLHLPQ